MPDDIAADLGGDAGAVSVDAAPSPAISEPSVETENLFEGLSPSPLNDEPKPDTDLNAAAPEGETPSPVAEPTPEQVEQRALFDKLKAEFEPDNLNFAALREKAKTFEDKYTSLKAFEPFVADPALAESIQKLATGQVTDGKEGWAAVESVVGLPKVVSDMRQEAFYHYADNPANADTIAQNMLGPHMDAATAKLVADATNPKGGWCTKEELVASIESWKNGSLTPEQQTEAARIAQDREALNTEMFAAKSQRVTGELEAFKGETEKATNGIFEFAVAPLRATHTQFNYDPNPNDPPIVAELRKEASDFYYMLFGQMIEADPEATSAKANIDGIVSQANPFAGVELAKLTPQQLDALLKDSENSRQIIPRLAQKAQSMYGIKLQERTEKIANMAAVRVNRFVKARVAQLRADAAKSDAAPKEIGSLSASGGIVATPNDNSLEARQARAREAFAAQPRQD